MGRNEHLPTYICVMPEFFCQLRKQFGVKLIFRFLYAKQSMGIWIAQQHQIGKHFNCSIGNEFGGKRVFEFVVLKAEDYISILSQLCLHIGYPGNTLLHCFQDRIKAIPVIIVEKFCYLRKIVSCC